jgi:hypothetical protein
MAEFGVITMATEHDYLKAVGLALSIRIHNPDVKIAIACYKNISDKIGHHFDYVIEQSHDLKGFEHKVHLDEYSPFEKTFFFDADILFFKDLQPIYEAWKGQPYAVRGGYVTSGIGSFGLDHKVVLSKINKPKLAMIGGAGHAYFEKPACKELFDLSRKITKDYTDYANPCRYADEDVVAIAMTILDIEPMTTKWFQARVIHANKGTLRMDVTKGLCRFEVGDGEVVEPNMVHFAVREGAFIYRKNLSKLFKENGINMEFELWKLAFNDFYVNNKKIKGIIKKIIQRFCALVLFKDTHGQKND